MCSHSAAVRVNVHGQTVLHRKARIRVRVWLRGMPVLTDVGPPLYAVDPGLVRGDACIRVPSRKDVLVLLCCILYRLLQLTYT